MRRSPDYEIFVSVDTEGKAFDGNMRTISVSYGREDGTSGSLSAPDGQWLNGAAVTMWLLENVIGAYRDAEGKQRIQTPVSFHFNYDLAVITKDFHDMQSIVYKSKDGRRYRNVLCNTIHKPGEVCRRIHRTDKAIQQLVITEGGENNLLAYHELSGLALATSAKRRFYAEYRPKGDDFTGNKRLDVHDTGTAFIGSLEKVIDDWQPAISEDQRDAIRWGKQTRKTGFTGGTVEQIEAYSEAECVAHAMCCRLLLSAVAAATDVELKPSELFGSGSIASAVLTHYGVVDRKQSITCDRTVMGLAIDDLPTMAYFGGLIEGPVLGVVNLVDEVDINSAYPSHMASMPCMREGHGEWHIGNSMTERLGYALVSWAVETPSTPPFLVRMKDGSVRSPLSCSRVWVTIPEARAAIDEFPNAILIHKVVNYEQTCECQPPLAFLATLYNKRLDVKLQMKAEERGSSEWKRLDSIQMAIKLVINSIYGKFAQRRPTPGKFSNLHYAAYITGRTRAQVRKESWLRESQGGTVVYQHTDSVLSTGGTPVDGGPSLGEWGMEKQSHKLFICQPGLAVSLGGGKKATRGCSADAFERAARIAAEDLIDFSTPPHTWPDFVVGRSVMLSRRQAIHESKGHLAGTFIDRPLSVSFHSSGKRDVYNAYRMDGEDRAWIVPPIRFIPPEDIASLADIRSFQSEIGRLLDQGADESQFELDDVL